MSETKKKKRIGDNARKIRVQLKAVEEMHREDVLRLIRTATESVGNLAVGDDPGGARKIDHASRVVVFGAGRIAGLRDAYDALTGVDTKVDTRLDSEVQHADNTPATKADGLGDENDDPDRDAGDK